MLAIGSAHGQGRKPTAATERLLFHRAHDALTQVIVADIFSPPVAARIYVYAHAAAYETLVLCQSGPYRSGAGQLPGLTPPPPLSLSGCQPALAATEALIAVGRTLVFSEKRLDELADQLWELASRQGYSAQTIVASRAVGKQMASHILAWAAGDQYRQTRSLRRYTPQKLPGAWLPTPPGYMAAVEPYWRRIRPLTLDSASHCRLQPPPPFGITPDNAFFKSARNVFDVCTNLTAEQRLIANYWDCNPFFLNTQGHMNFASKKLSPGGHWLAIAGQVSRQTNADLMKTSAAYFLTAVALMDGFISCWDGKYRYNVIRPETFINAHINENWRPLLQTPPFPEYPSGHSVISTASAVVLTSLFGPTLGFTDSTEVAYGLPVRRFQSFRQAADEASISRLYGGIHYREALDNGQLLGQQIGEQVLKRLQLLALPARK
ncbi:vanadium-dependent haloperoxidase [Spirosoma utsteinense]|uniref:Membrane-associated phospholipid phosphatase n=1 Tax=Spirosoma utsteinense TaxID=2585773 RepID=A0ABR6WDG4_9BACT|nr:vanadium-dependent haloperoxidase [Spirosoma utsteinense]MBC3788077.1 membrane-associated phospholipid phosphatase [Spirosoma utsteinense]MBC3793962.1 membrane-associated phospholipid phosphatase [Spirosoma utsteinense]